MMKFRFPAVAILSAALALGACGDSPSGPDSQDLRARQAAGSARFDRGYGATVFTITQDGQTTDFLALGATLQLDLHRDGTTTGRLLVPGGDEDGGDFDASMAGTWTIDGGTVSFQQDADTFVRDMPFTVHGNRLIGDATFGDVRVQVTLGKL